MSTVTNKSANSKTPTMKALTTDGKVWSDFGTATWADGAGTWKEPYTLRNKSANSKTPTNKTRVS